MVNPAIISTHAAGAAIKRSVLIHVRAKYDLPLGFRSPFNTQSPAMPLVIVKLGGSLLSLPDLADRIRRLLAHQPNDRILIVVGGGAATDVVRDWSRQHSLSEETAHWLALRSLSLTRTLVKELLPECAEVTSPEEALRHWENSSSSVLLNVECYLRDVAATDDNPLPHTWDVTSDSIAAWIAARWSADELILVKSTDLGTGITFEQARQAGLVDAHFPNIAIEVSRISWCNLLAESPRPRPWLQS